MKNKKNKLLYPLRVRIRTPPDQAQEHQRPFNFICKGVFCRPKKIEVNSDSIIYTFKCRSYKQRARKIKWLSLRFIIWVNSMRAVLMIPSVKWALVKEDYEVLKEWIYSLTDIEVLE